MTEAEAADAPQAIEAPCLSLQGISVCALLTFSDVVVRYAVCTMRFAAARKSGPSMAARALPATVCRSSAGRWQMACVRSEAYSRADARW